MSQSAADLTSHITITPPPCPVEKGEQHCVDGMLVGIIPESLWGILCLFAFFLQLYIKTEIFVADKNSKNLCKMKIYILHLSGMEALRFEHLVSYVNLTENLQMLPRFLLTYSFLFFWNEIKQI